MCANVCSAFCARLNTTMLYPACIKVLATSKLHSHPMAFQPKKQVSWYFLFVHFLVFGTLQELSVFFAEGG